MAAPQRVKAVVESVTVHGDGVYSVILAPCATPPRLRPGQFLHLTVDEYDPKGGFWPESRVFSVASGPSSSTLRIVYSVKGAYTRRMAGYLAPGRSVWLRLPYGEFVVDSLSAAAEAVTLLAGGTGISPFISYLEARLANRGDREKSVHLVYGVRAPELLLFTDLLLACLRDLRLFSVEVFVEERAGEVLLPGIRVRPGRASVESVLDTRGRVMYFLSGPPGMIEYFRGGLREGGVPSPMIQTDSWE